LLYAPFGELRGYPAPTPEDGITLLRLGTDRHPESNALKRKVKIKDILYIKI